MADAGTSPTDREDIARLFRDHDIEEYAVVSASTLHAPVGRRPGDLIPSAQTVILFGAETDEHVFSGTNDEISLKVRAFLNKIRRVEDDLCSALQSEGFEARAVRSVILQEGTIKGMLSLTHCAADAGLGVIGDNRLLISPRFGSRIGLGAGVTIKKMEETLRPESSIEGCNHCNNASGHVRSMRLHRARWIFFSCRNVTGSVPGFMRPVVFRFIRFGEWFPLSRQILNFLASRMVNACADCLVSCPRFHGDDSDRADQRGGRRTVG